MWHLSKLIGNLIKLSAFLDERGTIKRAKPRVFPESHPSRSIHQHSPTGINDNEQSSSSTRISRWCNWFFLTTVNTP